MGVVLHKGENCGFTDKTIIPTPKHQKSGGKQTIFFNNPPKIIGRMSVVGEKEGKGPLSDYFDKIVNDAKWGEKTFERAEIDMLMSAIRGSIESAEIKEENVDMLITGDLLNQLTSSSYAARDLTIPHLGLYSACSTMSESLAVGSSFVNAGYFDTVVCATVSHFATAERQFRYPPSHTPPWPAALTYGWSRSWS